MGAAKTPDNDREPEERREDDSHVRAWGLLASFLDQHTLSDPVAVERFVAEHPDQELALRRLLRGFHDLRGQKARNDGSVTGVDSNGSDTTDALVELLKRIREDIGGGTRFTPGDRIGSGGIGVVFKLWDANLHRHVAKKTIRADKLRPDPTLRVRWIARFLEEAQITAQLEHPGVVPIHDLGFEPDGQIYFTLRYVRGETFADAIQKAHSNVEGWNRTRAVSTLLRVCETMAFAHGKDVIHRDLKPSNVMVGKYGETYVMDWGLARKLGKPDLRDLRIRPAQPHSTNVLTDARQLEESGLFTVDGHALGTPSYMSPEQARSDVDQIGKATDVYALGAILYEILTGHPPYLEPGVRADAVTLCRWVIDGPPAKIHSRAPDAPAELVAICERAMAREPARRYPSVEEMAEDVRAFLENRVVKAHRTGPVTELSKWVARNRLAAGILSLLFVAISSIGFLFWWATSQKLSIEVATNRNARLAAIAITCETLSAEAWSISDCDPRAHEMATDWVARYDQLCSQSEELASLNCWLMKRVNPINPSLAATTRLEEAYKRLRAFEQRLVKALEQGSHDPSFARCSPSDALKFRQDLLSLPNTIELLEDEIARLAHEQEVSTRYNIRVGLPDSERSEALALLQFVPKSTQAFARLGLGRTSPLHRIRAVLGNAARIRAAESEARTMWAVAQMEISNRAICPAYEGYKIEPILGIVPLWRNSRTGLWEFWHVPSGERPMRTTDERVIIGRETGMLLVLLPPGSVWMGHQDSDPTARYYYRSPKKARVDRHEVKLDPYFIGAHEATQAQWIRLAGTNPSTYFSGGDAPNLRPLTDLHPVESVDHSSAEQFLPLWGLELPTEAQWLFATGFASHRTPVSIQSPNDPELVLACENLFHRFDFDPIRESEMDYFDGFVATAPVGSYPPNANGLYDILGNVSELCSDDMFNNSPNRDDLVVDSRTGARVRGSSQERVAAGGSYATPPNEFGTISYSVDRGIRKGAIDPRVGVRVVLNIDERVFSVKTVHTNGDNP